MYKDIKLKEPLSEASSFISKDLILQLLTEYEIYAFYLGYDFIYRKAYNSPLRKDDNPSFVIYAIQGKLRFKDYGSGESGDVFDFVQKLYALDFKQCLLKICLDFSLPVENINTSALPSYKKISGFITKNIPSSNSSVELKIKVRSWLNCDKEYWQTYGITSEILKFYNVFPVQYAYTNNDILIYTHKNECPCYAYLFFKDNKYTYKLYRPYSKSNKWKSNINRTILQGWDQLDAFSEILIITKSLKDVMVLKTLGINSLAMQNEISSIKHSVMLELRSRFTHIYLVQDYDRAGIIGTFKLTRIYRFLKWFFIQDKKTKTNGLKDISDFRKARGSEETINLLKIKLRYENKRT